MRSAFFRTLLEVAETDRRIHLIVGDLGFGVVEPFAGRFPDRYLNAGVAEQNMAGIAAGMALCDKVVFIYSIGNFSTLRCIEQIRNDICYHKANVKIVSVGGGFAYGALGITHHATEDIAIMRAMPEMVVVVPADPAEAAEATRAVAVHPGPCYLRLGRSGEGTIHQQINDFQLGHARLVRSGRDLAILACGGSVGLAVRVADMLESEGVSSRVLSMHTIKPLDVDAVISALRETKAMITIEEHSVIGGLGGAVAEVLAEQDGSRVHFRRFGIPSEFCSRVGSQQYLLSVSGLSEVEIVGKLRAMCRRLNVEKDAGVRA